jgi:uncharacterized membrane protein
MPINSIMLVGIALIVLGVVALAYQGITYTSRERVIDIGPIHATADTQKTIPLSPLLTIPLMRETGHGSTDDP